MLIQVFAGVCYEIQVRVLKIVDKKFKKQRCSSIEKGC